VQLVAGDGHRLGIVPRQPQAPRGQRSHPRRNLAPHRQHRPHRWAVAGLPRAGDNHSRRRLHIRKVDDPRIAGPVPGAVEDMAAVGGDHHLDADATGRLEGPGGAYLAQHRATAALVAGRVAAETGVVREWDLVYQSRSGPPGQPWLEPDVSEHLEYLAAQGVPAAVLVPIGFVSDHMEVVYDLDVLARETADRIALPMARAATPGTDPRFVSMVADLVRERLEDRAAGERAALSPLGPWRDACLAGCCPNPRGPRPAVAGED